MGKKAKLALRTSVSAAALCLNEQTDRIGLFIHAPPVLPASSGAHPDGMGCRVLPGRSEYAGDTRHYGTDAGLTPRS